MIPLCVCAAAIKDLYVSGLATRFYQAKMCSSVFVTMNPKCKRLVSDPSVLRAPIMIVPLMVLKPGVLSEISIP